MLRNKMNKSENVLFALMIFANLLSFVDNKTARQCLKEGFNKCLDIFLQRSNGWTFKDERCRITATTKLAHEINNLLGKLRSI